MNFQIKILIYKLMIWEMLQKTQKENKSKKDQKKNGMIGFVGSVRNRIFLP